MRSRFAWLLGTLLLAAATMSACDSKRFDRAAPGAECIGYDRERCVGAEPVTRCDPAALDEREAAGGTILRCDLAGSVVSER